MNIGEGLGRALMGVGLVLVIIGLIIMYGSRFFPLGRLPGDILVRRGNFTLFFPVMTMLVVSLLLSLLFNLFLRR